MHPIIIVGSGMAGYTLARELRKLDSHSQITLLTRDDGAAYSKPMLSNAFASGRTPDSLVSASPEKVADDLNITIITRCEVVSINPAERTINIRGENTNPENAIQECLPYRDLVLALGADPLRSMLAGDATDQLLSVNDLSDYAHFRRLAMGKSQFAIIGAGLVGCEFANDLHLAGFQVSVVGRTQHPLQGLIPPAMADALQAALDKVVWHCPSTVKALWQEGQYLVLEGTQTQIVRSELVLCAIGLRPRIALAQAAGLLVGTGIRVNSLLQTSDPHIYALGDCAEIDGRVLPYIMPLMQCARVLAQTLTGAPSRVVFPHMPIIIKTSVYPIIALPAPPDIQTEWVCEEASVQGLRFAQLDGQGRLRGFVLSGDKTVQRATMLARL